MKKEKNVVKIPLYAIIMMIIIIMSIMICAFGTKIIKSVAKYNVVKFAQTEDGNFEYETLEDGTIEIVTYLGENSEVTIPQAIDGKKVTSIGSHAFAFTTVKSVKIPEGISNIGNLAFSNCGGLSNIEFPQTLLKIGEDAFYYCASLENIELPEGLTTIGQQAFNYCANLKNIKIPKNVVEIGDRAFYGCSNLQEITVTNGNNAYTSENGVLFNKNKTKLICYPAQKQDKIYNIPEEVTSINSEAFYQCEYIEKIIIPTGVLVIEPSTFEGCRKLNEIVIPEGVTSIGEGAFSNCNSLKTINIPSNITKIENSTFFDCYELENIIIPEGVTSIGESAFSGCFSLGNVVIPEKTTNVGAFAFSNCSGLKSIRIPEGVNNIGTCAFNMCMELTEIEVDSKNKNYMSQEGVLFNKNKTEILCYPAGKIGETYNISEEVSTIHPYAFGFCTNLKKITIPSGVENIGYSAFENCENLLSVNIPNGITKIESSMFSYCTNLSEIVLPESITKIGNYAFGGCSNLKNIEIPKNVHTIAEDAFANCTSLSKITIPKGVTTIENNVFMGCTKLEEIILEEGNPKYKTNEGVLLNKEGTTIIAYPAGKKDTTYNIPSGVTKIGYNSFNGCVNLAKLEIPEEVTEISISAFSNCIGLIEINLPTKLQIIDYGTFRGCENLKKITIPESVTIIYGSAFEGCKSLEEVKISENVTGIEAFAFENCTGLTNIELPENIEGMSELAFKDSILNRNVESNINEIELPKIIKRTMELDDVLYSKEGVKLSNCTLSQDKTKLVIDSSTTGEIILQVNSGKLKGLKFKVIQEGREQEKVEISSETYEIADGYVSSIKAKTSKTEGTTVEVFKSNIETNVTEIKIYKGEEIVPDSELIATGMKVEFKLGNEVQEYKLVVNGDLTGDGQMDDIDLLRMARYIAGLDKNLNGTYLKAAEIHKDNNIADDIDLLKMVRILTGLDVL